MAEVILQKYIPSTSDFYGTLTDTSDDDITITVSGDSALVTLKLIGVQSVSGDTNKNMIKIVRPRTASDQNSNPSDKQTSYILDLNRVEDTINIKAFLTDGPTYTAWKKLWILRAMLSSGQVNNEPSTLRSAQIFDVTFNSSTIQASIERLTWKYEMDVPANDYITDGTNNSYEAARIEVAISLYLGNDKAST